MAQSRFTRADIENMVLALPDEERARLMLLLRASLPGETSADKGRREAVRERARSILLATEGVAGIRMEPGSRLRQHYAIRLVAAYRMYLEGIGEVVSGEVIGKDHSTVHYMKGVMEDVLRYPDMYSDISWLWRRVEKELGPVKETTIQPFKNNNHGCKKDNQECIHRGDAQGACP